MVPHLGDVAFFVGILVSGFTKNGKQALLGNVKGESVSKYFIFLNQESSASSSAIGEQLVVFARILHFPASGLNLTCTVQMVPPVVPGLPLLCI